MPKSEWENKTVINQRLKNRKDYMQGPKSSIQQWLTYTNSFKKFLAGRQRPVILILGATPELRDLALSYKNSKVIVVDFNLQTIKKMGSLMKNKNSDREKIIVCDWLKMPVKKHSVDLVVGDAVFANIRFYNFDQFYKKIFQVLRSDGFLLIRDVLRIQKYIKSPEEIIRLAAKQDWHWFDLYTILYGSSSGRWYSKRKNHIDTTIMYRWIDLAYKKGIINQSTFDLFDPWRSDLKHTVLPEKKFVEIFCRFFKPIKIKQPNDLRYQKFVKFFAGQPGRYEQ